MGIGNINDYSSFLRNYNAPAIPKVSAEEVRMQDEKRAQQELELQPIPREEAPVVAPVRNDAKLENLSVTFNKQDSFDYIGKDSNIDNLDMRKAISDMKKDQVLQQYQYFVGSAKNLFTDNADGIVIPK